LNAQQFHLLGVLRYLSGFDSDECKPSIREISALTGMHRQTIRKALVEMEEKGFLEVYRGEALEIVLFPGWEYANPKKSLQRGGGSKVTHPAEGGGGSELTQRVGQNCPTSGSDLTHPEGPHYKEKERENREEFKKENPDPIIIERTARQLGWSVNAQRFIADQAKFRWKMVVKEGLEATLARWIEVNKLDPQLVGKVERKPEVVDAGFSALGEFVVVYDNGKYRRGYPMPLGHDESLNRPGIVEAMPKGGEGAKEAVWGRWEAKWRGVWEANLEEGRKVMAEAMELAGFNSKHIPQII
jgi:hypothetical protein